MKNIICQKDEVCAECACELPKGSFAYINSDELFCDDCKDYQEN